MGSWFVENPAVETVDNEKQIALIVGMKKQLINKHVPEIIEYKIMHDRAM